ncbi:ABC transporter substrate-binding protein [Photobacterium rosenbergii]|uniref:ABC transporter substrate-binding protein n=2 Tax=Photobacterium rosenbergii TaxID=294936 RepID=A0A2T3N6R0_9GAMM|nr:ABC transporter substrate-binding protein [Photobacterium rosenbergii]
MGLSFAGKSIIAICAVPGLLADAFASGQPKEITLWRHQTGTSEMRASADQVARFNQSQQQWKVVVESLPQASYTESITAAALARQLPCILGVDQPTVPNFAWSGFLQPLFPLLAPSTYQGLSVGGRGMYQNQLYSVGPFDVALTLFTRYSILERFQIRVPSLSSPWTKEEFDSALQKLKASGEFSYPLDINAAWGDEWPSYGWAPLMQSFGADLIDRATYVEAEGILNSPEAVEFADWLSQLVEFGMIDRRPADSQGFINGRTAIHYTGSWSVRDYQQAFGEDLAILPVPDMGQGPVIGGGSWQWAITTSCKVPDGAAAFIDFVMQPEEIALFSKTTGFIPTKSSAAELTANYNIEGQWRVFYEFTKRYTVNRPATPAYAIISASFAKAMRDTLDGGEPQEELDMAVDNIERSIYNNRGFGFSLPQE